MTATITAGNWNNWPNFIPYNLSDKEQTHYLWEYGNNVNSPILTESNGAQIKKRLEAVGADFEMSENRGALRGTKQYAVLVRVADDSGNPIKVTVDELAAIQKDLSDYPILDDEDYSTRVADGNFDTLVTELKLHTADWDYPDSEAALLDVASDVMDILEERESKDEDWYPDMQGEVAEALTKLGYSRLEDEA